MASTSGDMELEDVTPPQNNFDDSMETEIVREESLMEKEIGSSTFSTSGVLPVISSSIDRSVKAFADKYGSAVRQQCLEQQMAVASALNREAELKAEILALRGRVDALQRQKQTLNQEYSAELLKSENETRSVKEESRKLDRQLKISDAKLNNKQKRFDQVKKKFEKTKKVMAKVTEEDKQLRDWLDSHSIKITEMTLGNEVNGEEANRQTVLCLYNINPKKPDKGFRVSFEGICSENKSFLIKDIYPDFEGSSSVVEHTTTDMLQLLKDCRKHWLRLCEENSPNSQNGDCSRDLFDSSTSNE